VKKYKNLLVLLVVFGSIHLLFVGALTPVFAKWFSNLYYQGSDSKTIFSRWSYVAAIWRYSDIIIWIPVAIWIFRDSRKDAFFVPWLWAILILISYYQGLIIYLLLRLLIDKERIEGSSP